MGGAGGRRGGVKLAYAPADGRRRARRALRRWWWAIALLLLVAVWWPYRHEVWRKGLVLWWQRELAGVKFEEGRVVYESYAAEAAQLIAASPGEYLPQSQAGKAVWYPREWRAFPWGEVRGGSGIVDAWPRTALVFCGHLKDPSGARRWVVAQLRAVPGRREESLQVWVYLLEPEMLSRRASVEKVVARIEVGRQWYGTVGYRIFSGRVARHDPTAFEFEYADGNGLRWKLRGTLTAGDQVEVSRSLMH